MESSLGDPFSPELLNSSPPINNEPMDIEATSTSSSPSPSPIIPIIGPTTRPNTFNFTLSSDPLAPSSPLFPNSANTHRLEASQARKRGPSFLIDNTPTILGRTTSLDTPNSAREAILKACDFIVLAYSSTESREEQSKLLDLLEVFQEYIEQGKITKASSIIASQIANLETATRQIETKTRKLASTTNSTTISKSPNTRPTYATVASTAPETSKWTLVTTKKPTPKTTTRVAANPLVSRRLILTQKGINSSYSPLALRNAFNKAFLEKGIQGLVITSITKSLKSNLVITTTSDYTVEFVLKKQVI